MNHSTPGLPVHHQLPEFTQTHVHRVSDAIQPSHPLLSPSPPTFNLSQHQSLQMSQFFTWGGQSTRVSASASFLPKKSQLVDKLREKRIKNSWLFFSWMASLCFLEYDSNHIFERLVQWPGSYTWSFIFVNCFWGYKSVVKFTLSNSGFHCVRISNTISSVHCIYNLGQIEHLFHQGNAPIS